MGSRSERRIYVGNLRSDIRARDLQNLFNKFGKILFVDLKIRRGPSYAFVEFEDSRDADDAVKARDGYDYNGDRLRVEYSRGEGPGFHYRAARNFRRDRRDSVRGDSGRRDSGRRDSDRRDSGRKEGGRGDSGRTDSRRKESGHGDGGVDGQRTPTKRSAHRVIVTGLPSTGSWQDLKDHMREAGNVCFADIYRDGVGVVEYVHREDMKYAIKTLHDSRFRSHDGDIANIRVREDLGNGLDYESPSGNYRERS